MALTIDNLHVHYGLSHVIQGITLEAKSGEVVGIFGRNGVGKTTLMKAVAGWVQPSNGSIALDGQPFTGLTPDRICRHSVGFVPEDRRIFPGLTVEENLRLGLMQRNQRSRDSDRAAVQKIYDRFPRLAERRRQTGTTLSGGEQQMLAMARVMIGEPRLVLIDEPSEGLAPMIAAEIFAIIAEMKKAGMIVLLVEQSVTMAMKLADRFAVIERGQVLFAGSTASSDDRQKGLSLLMI